MTERQLYDRIYDIVSNYIEWQLPYHSATLSENIATDIMNFLLKYKKVVSYIDLGEDNDNR